MVGAVWHHAASNGFKRFNQQQVWADGEIPDSPENLLLGSTDYKNAFGMEENAKKAKTAVLSELKKVH